jgi:hypothetical protein
VNDKNLNPIEKIKLLKGTIAEAAESLRELLSTTPQSQLKQDLENYVLDPLYKVLNWPSARDITTLIEFKNHLLKRKNLND